MQSRLLTHLVLMAIYCNGRQGEVAILLLHLENTVSVNELAAVVA